METGATEGAREALAATVVRALRQGTRQSVHPADQAALRQAAARVAAALQAEFLLVPRPASAAGPAETGARQEAAHE